MSDWSESWATYEYAEELRGYLAEHPDSFVLDHAGEVLHRANCATIQDALADGTLWASWGCDSGRLERHALSRGSVTFCQLCDPPSEYFDLTEFRIWERVWGDDAGRIHNCQARHVRRCRGSITDVRQHCTSDRV
jgi:hypothetical protein